MRLDRFIAHKTGQGSSKIRLLLASKTVIVDDKPQTNSHYPITQFTKVAIGEKILQNNTPIYLMLNKPAGYLSATKDPIHPTVMELIPKDLSHKLHIAGRLDRASTGLLLLTNDGKWSKNLTEPKKVISKIYTVETAFPITQESIKSFAQGFYFAYEDLTTQPAKLEIFSLKQARITIHEGRYHQIKRMFHAVGNKITALHRDQIGNIKLDPTLKPGEYRELTPIEINPRPLTTSQEVD